MIDFKGIIGHYRPIKILKNIIKHNMVGHSYLFIGKEGIGKKLTAIAFSKGINCLNLSSSQEPCNSCFSCIKIENNVSTDFNIISPVNSVIKINVIRELKNNIYFQPLKNKKKVYIIDDADKMTLEASNSLLKILEEPPDYAILILITSVPDLILPTIISRCSKVIFKPLSIDSQKNILLKNIPVDNKKIEGFIKLSHGSPGKALNLFADKDRANLKYKFIDKFTGLSPGEFSSFTFSYEKLFPNISDNFNDFVEMMILWFRDVLFLKMDIDKNQLFFKEYLGVLTRHAHYFTKKRLIMILEYLINIPEDLEKHINQNTLLENFFIRLGDR